MLLSNVILQWGGLVDMERAGWVVTYIVRTHGRGQTTQRSCMHVLLRMRYTFLLEPIYPN